MIRTTQYMISLVVAACFLAVSPCRADSKKTVSGSEVGIRIIPQRMEVRDDSVRIDLTITASNLRIPTDQSLRLIPELHYKGHRVVLPPVVITGKQRARFDRREETVDPARRPVAPYHVWVGLRRGNNYNLRYRVSIPYASWMLHASLRLRQISRDCCTEFQLADDLLTNDINLTSPCETGSAENDIMATLAKSAPVVKAKAPAKAPAVRPAVHVAQVYETEHRAVMSLYIDYPRGASQVEPRYGRNHLELQKVDSLLSTLLGNPAVTIREIRVTGYASPDGAYYDNETLAKARSLGFRAYLSKAYGLQDYPFRTAWVAEDWEGLRRLLKGRPYEASAQQVINRYGIFEGRERILMEMEGGWPYKEMLRELFPRLRRMEIIVIYKTEVQK